MKNACAIISLLLVFSFNTLFAADTLYYRFNNFTVVDASPYDTLIFDIELKTSTGGTYLSTYQIDIKFNTTTFGSSALPVSYEELDLVGPGLFIAMPPRNVGTNQFRFGNAPFLPPYYPSSFVLVPTTGWGKLVRVKMLVLDNSQGCGVEFAVGSMAGNEKFIKQVTSSMTNYSPLVATNSLLNLPSTPSIFNLMITELGDPVDSGADFVEIYNPGPASVDLSLYPWYLTIYNGTGYQNIRLTGGTLNAGETHVVAGNSFAGAYTGKSADQLASFVENSGNVSYYLSIFGDYNEGTPVDGYNGIALPFPGQQAIRPYNHTAPNTTFTPGEWKFFTAATIDMTPGSHRVTLLWDGSTDEEWRDTTNWTRPYVPDIGHNAVIPYDVERSPVITVGDTGRCHNLHVDGIPE